MSLSPAFLDELRGRTHLSALVGKSVKLTRAGHKTVIVRVSRKTAARLRRARSMRVTLTTTATYNSGKAGRLTRHVRLKR